MDAEANGAISIAKAANAVYAGTVTRLIFTNEFVTDATTTNEVYDLINQPQGATPSYKDQAHSLGLRGGRALEYLRPAHQSELALSRAAAEPGEERRLHHAEPVSRRMSTPRRHSKGRRTLQCNTMRSWPRRGASIRISTC